MNSRVIYQVEGSPVSVLIPADCGMSLIDIGKKDVPAGVPFWVVPSSVIPADRAFRDAWYLDHSDMGPPSGIGEKA